MQSPLLFTPLFRADDEPQGLVIGEVVPYPIQENEQFVLDAQYLEQVYKKPNQPSEEALELRACWDFSNRSANCTFLPAEVLGTQAGSLILRPENPHLAQAKLRFSGLV
jgi:hypothetical protein